MILDHIGYNVRDVAASKAFYGACVIDPGGNDIEAVCHHAE